MKLIVEENGKIEEFELKEGEFLVGRAEDCQIRIKDPYLSRHHFKIIVKEGKVKIEEVKSRSGIFLNKEKIKEGEFKPGDVVLAGETKFTLIAEELEETLIKEVSFDETLVKTGESEKKGENKKMVKPFRGNQVSLKMFDITPVVKFWKVAGIIGALLIVFSLLSLPSEKKEISSQKRIVSQKRKLENKREITRRAEGKPVNMEEKKKKESSPEEVKSFPEMISGEKKYASAESSVSKKKERKEKNTVKKEKKKSENHSKRFSQKRTEVKPIAQKPDPKIQLALFNFKNLLKKAEEKKKEGRIEEALEVCKRACSIAKRFLEESYEKRCEREKGGVILALARKLHTQGEPLKAYSLMYRAGSDLDRDFVLSLENELKEKIKEIYARSALDVEESRRNLERILNAVPEGSPIHNRAKSVLERLR